MRLPVSSSSYSSMTDPASFPKNFFDALRQPAGRSRASPTDADVAGHHALAGDELENLQDFFALAEA